MKGKTQFYSFLDTHKPDIAVGTETLLTPDIHDSEFFPTDLVYTTYRRDHSGQKGGGVIFLVKSSLSSHAKPEYITECENLWIQLNLVGSKSVLIGHITNPRS